MGPNAAVATEDVVYWMGIDNFYTYSGQTKQLNCTVKIMSLTILTSLSQIRYMEELTLSFQR